MFFTASPRISIDLYFNKHLSACPWAAAAVEKNLAFEGNVIFGDELIPLRTGLASKAYNEYFNREPNMAQLMTGVVLGLNTNNPIVMCCSAHQRLETKNLPCMCCFDAEATR